MDKNTLYLYESNNQSIEVGICTEIVHSISLKKLFHQLLLEKLTTLKGRLDATKEILGCSYNIPIYCDECLIFFSIKETNRIYWINGANVMGWKQVNGESKILFRSGKELIVNKSARSIAGAMEKIEILKNL